MYILKPPSGRIFIGPPSCIHPTPRSVFSGVGGGRVV